MIERAGIRFNIGDYVNVEIDTEGPTCTCKGTIDGEPVDFSGGQGESLKKILTKTYTITQTSSDPVEIDRVDVSDSMWPANKIILVEIKDLSPINGKFYGFINSALRKANDVQPVTQAYCRFKLSAQGVLELNATTDGVYIDWYSGYFLVKAKKTSSSGAINSEYVLNVYTFDYPDGFYIETE